MDPTIEALTIHPAAWAALFQGLAQGIAFGAAVIASVLVVAVVLIACFGGRRQAEAALDEAAEQVVMQIPEPEVDTAGAFSGPRRVHAPRRRPVCQRASGQWSVIARQPESVR